jgi:hypothetical protein
MLDLTYSTPRRELAPARALLTPTWVVSLILLVANDHWLKGSGLLPGVITGKLSDFVGMIVAPVLLATLLCVRSKRALALCHIAVGLVFAGIKLSPAFADQWSALMGLFGYPWLIVCDPTDLLALPFLLLSWTLLVPEMDPSKPAMVPLQRTAVAALSVFGLWSTVATSDNSRMDFDDEWYVDVYGHVFVNNSNDFAISLHIRPLRDDLELNCDEVSLEPGRLLTVDAFGDAEHWELPAWTNVGIELTNELNDNDCGAAMIAGEGVPPTIVFVNDLSAPMWFPGQVFEASTLGSHGIGVQFADNGGEWTGGEMIRFTPKSDTPELPEVCEAPAGETRLDWPLAAPTRNVELLAIEAGVDGCFELNLQDVAVSTGEIVPVGEPYPFYLCAPAAAVPFAAGERLEFRQIVGASGERELAVSLLEPGTLELAVADSGAPVRRIRYLRGGTQPQFIGPALSQDLVALPAFSCPWMVEEGCATVERPVELAVAGDDIIFAPGVPVQFTDNPVPSMMTAMVSYARERAIVDQSCSEGALRLDYDIDFILIEEPLI